LVIYYSNVGDEAPLLKASATRDKQGCNVNTN
jgi:hypothetical protein